MFLFDLPDWMGFYQIWKIFFELPDKMYAKWGMIHIELPIRAGKTKVQQDTFGCPNKKTQFWVFNWILWSAGIEALTCDWDAYNVGNSKKMLHDELQPGLIYSF